jgi:FkbM family methyltransferase
MRRNTNDRGIVIEVYSNKDYKFDFINPDSVQTVVDIGGHIGSFSIRSEQAFPTAQIYSFELMKENYDLFLRNLDINKCNRIHAVQGAVYGVKKPSHFKFVMPQNNTGASELGFDKDTIIGETLISWESIQDKDIDVLKLDCEGSEQSIIPAIKCARVGIVMIEFHLMIYDRVYSEQVYNDLIKHFVDGGMKVYYRIWHECPNSALPFFIFVNEKYCIEKNLLKVI